MKDKSVDCFAHIAEEANLRRIDRDLYQDKENHKIYYRTPYGFYPEGVFVNYIEDDGDTAFIIILCIVAAILVGIGMLLGGWLL